MINFSIKSKSYPYDFSYDKYSAPKDGRKNLRRCKFCNKIFSILKSNGKEWFTGNEFYLCPHHTRSEIENLVKDWYKIDDKT